MVEPVTDLAAGTAGEHIDCRRIAYLPPSKQKQTVHIRPHDDPSPPRHGGKSGKTFTQFPFVTALAEVLHVA